VCTLEESKRKDQFSTQVRVKTKSHLMYQLLSMRLKFRPLAYTACHTCTVLSSLAEAMREPSGDQASAFTPLE
jgi:hypothetical protein